MKPIRDLFRFYWIFGSGFVVGCLFEAFAMTYPRVVMALIGGLHG